MYYAKCIYTLIAVAVALASQRPYWYCTTLLVQVLPTSNAGTNIRQLL